jgi:CubicO group peptidase (beta-lactamase class C family)
VTVCAAACAPFTGPQSLPPAESLAQFERQLDGLRAQLAIAGMSAIVMSHDTVLWEGSLGVVDLLSQRPVTPQTQFHLASLTKTFASTIVLQLVEEGLVDLDDPISN